MPLRPLHIASTILSPFAQFCERWKGGCGAEECSRARNVVHLRGKIPCDVLFAGEGPGASEDVLGKPFVGPAGELLQRIIDQAVPPEVRYGICNVVGCLPTDEEGNKSGEPSSDQVMTCKPRTEELIRLCNPRLLVCVGKVAWTWTDHKLHHRVDVDPLIPRIEIVHPASILRVNMAGRGLLVQQCIVRISNAIAEHLDGATSAG